jgi:hypothetical protein
MNILVMKRGLRHEALGFGFKHLSINPKPQSSSLKP